MEEDVKKCETLLGSERWVLGTQDKKALENLIKGYRELEIENQSYRDYLGEPPCYDNASYTPKSKIKEKIEELETKLKVFEKDIRYCKDKVEARLMNDEIYVLRRCMDLLQELMEDK